MMTVKIVIAGCGRIGSKFAKEVVRFIGMKSDSNLYRIYLFDPAEVTENDIVGQEYRQEDIGFHKAGILSGVLKENFPNVAVKGYLELTSDTLKEAVYQNSYSGSNNEMFLLYDFSNNDKVGEVFKNFISNVPNYFVFTPVDGGLQTGVKLSGFEISPVAERAGEYKKISPAQALLLCRLCFAETVRIINDHTICDANLYLQEDRIGCGATEQMVSGGYVKPITVREQTEPLLCICVGAGGTGGNLIAELANSYMQQSDVLSLLVIDGDRVEEKNRERQPFSAKDILQNKASVLTEDLTQEYPNLKGRMFSYGQYIDKVEDLYEAVSVTGLSATSGLLLVGAVDNHRARQVMEQFYHGCENIVYVDAANEWSNGEVITSVKKNGAELSPLRSFYYPEVLTDHSPSASEISCGAINQSAPQHLATNLTSAQNICSIIEPLISIGKVTGGITYFDAFKPFTRFQPVVMADTQVIGEG